VVLEHKREPHPLHLKETVALHHWLLLSKAGLAACQLSTADGEVSEHGEVAQQDAELEHKQELELVSLVMHVELDVLDLPLKQDRVVLPLSTADGEHLEHGEPVQQNAELDHKRDLEFASLVMSVELDVLDTV